MVSTLLYVSGAQTRHRNQLQHDENTEVVEHSVLGPFTL